jgi:D-alanyl-D-alanine carboxypeptidase
MKKHRVPGVSFVLVDDQEIITAHSFGFADLEARVPVESGIIFKLWSVARAFNAIEIMRLVNDGLVRLDDPVISHIPNFTIKSRFPDEGGITIRHILSRR